MKKPDRSIDSILKRGRAYEARVRRENSAARRQSERALEKLERQIRSDTPRGSKGRTEVPRPQKLSTSVNHLLIAISVFFVGSALSSAYLEGDKAATDLPSNEIVVPVINASLNAEGPEDSESSSAPSLGDRQLHSLEVSPSGRVIAITTPQIQSDNLYRLFILDCKSGQYALAAEALDLEFVLTAKSMLADTDYELRALSDFVAPGTEQVELFSFAC